MNSSIDIMARRSRIFELYAQGLSPVDIQRMIASEHEVSERTVRTDLQKMDDWLPVLVKMSASSDNRAAELLAMNQLIRKKLMNLAETSKHDPSRVGALKAAQESIKSEMAFLQSLGKMDKVADKVKAEVTSNVPMIFFDKDTALIFPKKKEDDQGE